jgi:hypothetical protein
MFNISANTDPQQQQAASLQMMRHAKPVNAYI